MAIDSVEDMKILSTAYARKERAMKNGAVCRCGGLIVAEEEQGVPQQKRRAVQNGS